MIQFHRERHRRHRRRHRRRGVDKRNLRVRFVILRVNRGRRAPVDVLHRNPCRRRPLLMNIERVQYAIRRLSSSSSSAGFCVDVDAAVFGGLIQRHNFPARIRWARIFAVDIDIPRLCVLRNRG